MRIIIKNFYIKHIVRYLFLATFVSQQEKWSNILLKKRDNQSN